MPADNARSGVRRADVLGRNIVPICPPPRQAAGTLAASGDRQCITTLLERNLRNERQDTREAVRAR
jgi:hypothetical protein